MNINAKKPLLSTLLLFVLSVLASSHSVSHVTANDVFATDTTPVSSNIQNDFKGMPKGDAPDLHLASTWESLPPKQLGYLASAKPVKDSSIAFTVSQARAPPRF